MDALANRGDAASEDVPGRKGDTVHVGGVPSAGDRDTLVEAGDSVIEGCFAH